MTPGRGRLWRSSKLWTLWKGISKPSHFSRKHSVSSEIILLRSASSIILSKTWLTQTISPRYLAWASRTYLRSSQSTQFGTPRVTRYLWAKNKTCRERRRRRRRSEAEEAHKDTHLCRIKLQVDRAHRPSTTTRFTPNQRARITNCPHHRSIWPHRMYLPQLYKIQSHFSSASSSAVTRV